MYPKRWKRTKKVISIMTTFAMLSSTMGTAAAAASINTDYEPVMALDGGADGLDYYHVIASKWKSALRLGGTLIFEVGLGQAGAVEDILDKNGYEDIKVLPDTQNILRVVEGTINN